jgi:hypothetical protein
MSLRRTVCARAARLLPLIAIAACSSSDPEQAAHAQPDAQPAADAADAGVAADAGPDDAPVGPVGEWQPPTPPCNGVPDFCARAYTDVSLPGTHHSAARGALTWQHPTQGTTIREQLDDAVRALWLEVHRVAGALVVCRGDCAEGSEPLGIVLADITAFLDVNPREVVTIALFGGVAAVDLAPAFATAKLDTYAHAHDSAQPWPTMSEMVESGKRVVVLSDGPGGGPAWVLPIWEHAFATEAGSASTVTMDCSVAYGSQTNAIFIVNHFLGVEGLPVVPSGDAGSDAGADADAAASSGAAAAHFGDPDGGGAAVANAAPLFAERVSRCQKLYGRRAAIVFVDDYEIGNTVTVLRQLALAK